jgi:hypothetical protein
MQIQVQTKSRNNFTWLVKKTPTIGKIYQSIFDVNQGMQLINTSNWNKGVYNMQISSEIDPVYNFKFLIIR